MNYIMYLLFSFNFLFMKGVNISICIYIYFILKYFCDVE